MTGIVSNPSVLIVDDDAEVRYSLQRVLSGHGYNVIEAASGEEGLTRAEEHHPHIIFLDNRMEGLTGIETLQHLRSIDDRFMVILMTAFGTTQTAIEAMKYGAYDYIVKPFDIERVLSLAAGAVKARTDISQVSEAHEPKLDAEDYKEGIVGSSEAMQFVFKTIGQVAASEVTVMVTGESGTGKELVARAICQHSHRSKKPFMAVNCAAIPDNLIESELFGHEKGAFTGASAQRQGKFELCDGGTLFLDEIGDMSLTTQTKILRALQEGEIQRVGGSSTIKVDVRLIAATNKDLERMVAERTFREDLYYRLNVVRIKLPSLRERIEDVPDLVEFMLQRMRKGGKTKVKTVSSEARELLMRYRWPGNVRELENVIQRSAVIAQGEMVLSKDLPQELMHAISNGGSQEAVPASSDMPVGGTLSPMSSVSTVAKSDVKIKQEEPTAPVATVPVVAPPEVVGATVSEPISDEIEPEKAMDLIYSVMRKSVDKDMLQELEREMTQRALVEMKGNQVRTAALLGITRATLRKRIDQYSLKY